MAGELDVIKNMLAHIIFDKVITAFGLSINMKTNPQIMRGIIEEIKLNDLHTKNERMSKFFRKIIAEPQDLGPMLENIKKGVISKHPAIIEFAELALKNNWFRPSEHISKTIHLTFILEALTATMCNSHDFFIEIQDHYKTKEQSRGINAKHTLSTFVHALGITHNFFGTVKALSADPAMIYLRIERGLANSRLKNKEAKKLLRDKKINYLEYKLLSPLRKNGLEHINELIEVNIYEAGIAEYKKGSKTNAICAHVLAEDIKNNRPLATFRKKNIVPESNTDEFYESIIEKENIFPVIEFSQDWVSLYITWNMTFILTNMDDLDLLFPKLLIPSIINSESENFAGARIISLWLSINHVLYRKYDKKTVTGPTNKTEMVRAWSEINKKYALALADREIHESSKVLKKSFQRMFGWPVFNLIKLMIRFLV